MDEIEPFDTSKPTQSDPPLTRLYPPSFAKQPTNRALNIQMYEPVGTFLLQANTLDHLDVPLCPSSLALWLSIFSCVPLIFSLYLSVFSFPFWCPLFYTSFSPPSTPLSNQEWHIFIFFGLLYLYITLTANTKHPDADAHCLFSPTLQNFHPIAHV